MDLVVLGSSHETAPIDLRERLAIPSESLHDALAKIVKLPGVPESVILSTCNRVELYCAAHVPESGLSTLRDFLSTHSGVTPAELDGRVFALSGHSALKHVFRVASSLDSLVVGEPQILGQLKDAYQIALGAKAAGPVLNRVLPKAFSVAKRVRSETGIAEHAVSVSYAAVELGKKIFGDLRGKTVLLVGAGEMGELAARHLQKHGAREILIANRTWERAVELAKDFGGTPVQLEKLSNWLAQADIVIGAAAAQGRYLLTQQMMHDAIRERRHRPIFLVDIAVPRIVDPACGGLADVYLYSVDDLRGVVDANLAERRKEAAKAEAIVDEETKGFALTLAQIDLAPVIHSLSSHLETIRFREVSKSLSTTLKALTPEQREAIEKMTHAMMSKVAHAPISSLKEGALDADLMRRIFALAEVESLPPGGDDDE